MSKLSVLEVVSVERLDGTEIIVEFSDSTCASYTTQELLDLRPNRPRVASEAPGMPRR